MYNWADVAARTEAVYTSALSEPHSAALAPRLPRLLACGRIYGLLIVAFSALCALWHAVVCWLDPEESIQRAASFSNACGACTVEGPDSLGSLEPASKTSANVGAVAAGHASCHECDKHTAGVDASLPREEQALPREIGEEGSEQWDSGAPRRRR